MINTGHATRSCLTIFCAALVTLAVGLSVTTPAYAAERVLIWGDSTDSEHQPDFANDLQTKREYLCMAEGPITMAWDKTRLEMGSIAAELALPMDIAAEADQAYRQAADAVCRGEDIDLSSFTSSKAFIVYSHCSMFMRSTDAEGNDLGGLSIYLNESISEALMYFRDPETGKAYKVAINREMQAARQPVPDEPEIFGAGRTTAASMERIGGPQVMMIGRPDEMIGYEAYHYQYDYTSSLTGGMMGDAVEDSSNFSGGQTPFSSLGAMTKVTTTGTAWIAPDAPGVAIINTFYDNFARIVEGQQGAMSFIGGMLRNQAAITASGIPLSSVVDTQAAMGMHSTSTFDAIDVKVIPARVDECIARPVPAGWTVTDLNEELNSASYGQSASSAQAAQQQAEYATAMQQASEAMAQMTPEQRKMMEQFGLGGAMPAAAAPAPEAKATAAKRSMPSSAELQSDDITQMVQKHLQALGYDTGNTAGDLSTETIIAISQFQAEKGLEVTGEVSPQLAGILSAEVDKQRGE
jgi:hypothetical protein